MNYNELVEVFDKEFGERIRDYYGTYRKPNFCQVLIDEDYGEFSDKDKTKFKELFGEYEFVKTVTDVEVFDEYYSTEKKEIVIYFKEHDVYVRCKGEFSSYDGTGWSSQEEVLPRKVVITAFETEKERGDKTDEA